MASLSFVLLQKASLGVQKRLGTLFRLVWAHLHPFCPTPPPFMTLRHNPGLLKTRQQSAMGGNDVEPRDYINSLAVNELISFTKVSQLKRKEQLSTPKVFKMIAFLNERKQARSVLQGYSILEQRKCDDK